MYLAERQIFPPAPRCERFRSTPLRDRGILLGIGWAGFFVERKTRLWIGKPNRSIRLKTVVHRDFPNPDRIGCPGRNSLVDLATCVGDAQSSAPVLAHIRQCAPCFDELNELRRKQCNEWSHQRRTGAPIVDARLGRPRES